MTPGFLRGECVTAIINAVHGGCHDTWQLIECEALDVFSSRLTFAVGALIPPSHLPPGKVWRDDRKRVMVMITEDVTP